MKTLTIKEELEIAKKKVEQKEWRKKNRECKRRLEKERELLI